MAPVWHLPPLDGAVLKQQGGPFFPELQHDLDRLVGAGVAEISGLKYVQDDSGRWRLEGCYRPNRLYADRAFQASQVFNDERRLASFLFELAYALAALTDDELDRVVTEDATYTDPLVTFDNVIDLQTESGKNYSANAAREFDRVASGGTTSSGEKLHLYIRHLRRRMYGER